MKHCHGDPRSPKQGPSPDLFRRAVETFAVQEAEERRRIERFGQIRPVISADTSGVRLVTVRNRLYPGKWKYFPDFLDEFLRGQFGKTFAVEQDKLDANEQHPVLHWRRRAHAYREKILEGKTVDIGVRPNGSMAAYFGLAYDLYVVDDNNTLDSRLLERLKNREQFQGARHELFVEAACLRAGFSIEREDESDPTQRHVEFTATHRKTRFRLAVEAKSRHRPAVIAHPGKPSLEDQVDFRFSRLINKAIAKRPKHPLAIFIDTNLPPRGAEKFFVRALRQPEPSKYLSSIITGVRKKNDGFDPYNLLVFTNNPHHYGKDDELDPAGDWIAYAAETPLIQVADPRPLRELAAACDLYGNIPQSFPAQR